MSDKSARDNIYSGYKRGTLEKIHIDRQSFEESRTDYITRSA